MKIVKKKLSALHPADRNIRMHPEKQIKEFRRSIEMFGQIRPIVVDSDGTVLAGNGLYQTLLAMGAEEADCLIVGDLTEAQKKKLMIADNKIYGLGVDDYDVLDAFLLELKGDLDIPGFDADILNIMLAEPDDVKEAMQDYGKLSPEEAAGVVAGGERMQARADTPTDQNTQGESLQQPGNAEQKRIVICPNCGTEICL